MSKVTPILEKFLADLDGEARECFLMNHIEQSGGDKLWHGPSLTKRLPELDLSKETCPRCRSEEGF